MKITSWNVNGLRAVIGKGALDWLKIERPDILCLQEIKTRPEQLSELYQQSLDGYHAWWNPADRPGYSGVASFTRQEPESVQFGFQEPRFDCEGRSILTCHPGFMLFNIYFPNGGRGLERTAYKLDFYAHLLEICDRLHAKGEKIVICGDFNTAHQEIDLRNSRQNITTSGFLPEERAWIDKYLQHGFVDAYRQLYPQRIQYTWWTFRVGARQRNIGWRIDYFMVSEALMPQVRDVIIHEEILGSDHCPVSLVID